MALLVAVVIQFMVQKTSDSSIVRYENEGLCGYVLLNSNFIFLVTHTTKIRFHV